MNNSKAETRLCQLSENGNSSSSPHLNLKSNSRQDMSIERGRFSSKMSVKRRESLQVYSKRFPQQKKPKSFLMPRTKSLSKNSPIIRRCSLQEDQSILVFQVNCILWITAKQSPLGGAREVVFSTRWCSQMVTLTLATVSSKWIKQQSTTKHWCLNLPKAKELGHCWNKRGCYRRKWNKSFFKFTCITWCRYDETQNENCICFNPKDSTK